jgi:hypothetical protein
LDDFSATNCLKGCFKRSQANLTSKIADEVPVILSGVPSVVGVDTKETWTLALAKALEKWKYDNMWPKAENIHRCLSKFLAKKKKDPVR